MLSSNVHANLGKPLGLATVQAGSLTGLRAHPVFVEVCSTRGPAFFQLVGLAEAAVREARVRVASALARLGILLDEYAITVNLAPADVRKTGASLDLAIAVGVLGAMGAVPTQACENVLLIGELALDGLLRPVAGILPQLEGARSRGIGAAIVPAANAREAGISSDIDVRVAESLKNVIDHLLGQTPLSAAPKTTFAPKPLALGSPDLADVRGQSLARRALEIAAAGGHNLLMVGPPGSGKTLLARALPSILPPLSFEEAIETTAVHSVAGLVDPGVGIVDSRPFRAPHHSVSSVGLIGGGEVPRPGEVSLAHNGILFLDELAEFRRSALESLRQPLEDGHVNVVRARARAQFPARPMIVAAVNPCPCGYRGHPRRPCRCSYKQRRSYLGRLSGPLLDRLDVHVHVPPVDVRSLTQTAKQESSATVYARVRAARERQLARSHAGSTRARCNAALELVELDAVARPDAEGKRLLSAAVDQLGLSARAYAKVLRVARTIADLENEVHVNARHVAEAIQGRLLDREPAP